MRQEFCDKLSSFSKYCYATANLLSHAQKSLTESKKFYLIFKILLTNVVNNRMEIGNYFLFEIKQENQTKFQILSQSQYK